MSYFSFSDSLYGIKYGESTYSSRYIFFGDKENKQLPFDWLFYLIKTKDKIILIDCGFYSKNLIKLYDIDYKSPITILQENNIKTDEITDVIITHSHFDHIENIVNFSNANIYIQEDELKFYMNDKFSNKSVVNFLSSNKKIITFKENYNFSPNIKIIKIGGHTIGSSIVEFTLNKKKFLFVSDEIYVNENYSKKIGVGTYYNHKKNTEFINSLSNDQSEILLFHQSTGKNKDIFLIYEE
ncbi:MAG TPA: MBL fold metallo-hydrolase [Spirochaetota bacterium]|nr:MBL fold metallo-hydrolase [Spirochaetota bacterium]